MKFPALIMTLLTLFLSACGQGSPDSSVTFEQPADTHPALWEVRAETGGSAYVFGSVHALPPGIDWRGDIIDQAIASSDTLMLEISPDETPEKISETFSVMGTTPGQPSLDDRINGELRDEAGELAERYDLSSLSISHMESWALALTISANAARTVGADRQYGVETVLTREFRKRGKRISGLETARQQFGYFDTLAEADQRAMLETMIAEAENVVPSYRQLLHNWLTGDMDAIARETVDGLLARTNIRQAVLVARNRDWAAKIAEKLANGGDERIFIAVGAGHLAGEDNMLQMLADMGFTVTRLQ